MDWFFGVDMGIYHTPGEPPLVPDGFLSLGVEWFIGEEGRLSYVLWEEDNVVPLWALEVVSKTYSGEYEQKKIAYAQLGILYYLIYAPSRGKRRKRQSFEVYRLVEGQYVLQKSEPVWIPEMGLAIGRSRGTYWDERGNGYTGMTRKAEGYQLQKNWHSGKLNGLQWLNNVLNF
jgi:Uma2 family endonuclease